MKHFLVILSSCVLIACGGGGGGGGGGSAAPASTLLTVTGTAATGLAIPGAIITGKCKVGTNTATTLADGSFALRINDGELPCVLQITNPVDGIKLHTVVTGTGSTATANITPLTEMVTARVLGREPNVYFAAFDASVAVEKITSATVQAAQTEIGLVLIGTVNTTALNNFISAPFKAATQGNPTAGDAQDKLLDELKLKLSSTQIRTLATALASSQTTEAIKQTVAKMTGGGITTPTVPVANASAAQSVVTGMAVTLDASTSSAAAGKSLIYVWTLVSKPAGSSATLVAPTTPKPTFVADVAGAYVASVIVNDGTSASSAAAVTITASTANAAPVANASGAQNVVAGSVVTLDGSASSDANSDPLTYAWTLTSKPAGSTAVLSSTTSAKPTFTANLAGTYVASLIVNDSKVNSTTVTVSITATVANAAPVANAGVAQNVVAGSLVTLDGRASSDANSDPLTYAWILTSKPAGSTAALSSATSAKPTFTADVAGTYVSTLAVNDSKVNSIATTVTTTATMKAIAFDSLTGGWDGIANAKSFTSDNLKLSVSISGTILTIRAEQFFDGTCNYAATLNANHSAVTAGTYQCSDFTSGSWSLLDMQRVDQNDIYIRLKRDGVTDKRLYGLAQVGVNSAKVIPVPISTLAGTYAAISTGGPFGTQPARNSQIAVDGTTLTITLARFFSGTCQYTATIQADGLSISAPTYRCADFSTGTWSLNDVRAIGGEDFYLSISKNGVLERAYGIR